VAPLKRPISFNDRPLFAQQMMGGEYIFNDYSLKFYKKQMFFRLSQSIYP